MTFHTVVVIPAYNEASQIRDVIQKTKMIAAITTIIVVDDGSSDETKTIAQEEGALVISHLINRGAGAAIQTGIAAALQLNADIIVTMDGDGQFSPEHITRVIEPIRRGEAEVVIGNRFMQVNTIPLLRRFYNFIASIITLLLAGIYVGDSQSGFKAFSRNAAKKIDIHTSGYEFCSEMIREIAYHQLLIKEVPVDVYYTIESLKKGQNFAGGIRTVGKLLVRTLMR